MYRKGARSARTPGLLMPNPGQRRVRRRAGPKLGGPDASLHEDDRTGGAALYPRLESRQHQAARVGEDDECEAVTADRTVQPGPAEVRPGPPATGSATGSVSLLPTVIRCVGTLRRECQRPSQDQSQVRD